MPPGISGVIVALLMFIAIMAAAYWSRKQGPFNLDPDGIPNAFEPFLTKYIRLSEYIIGLATGSIVLLVGSSALHAQGGKLPNFYASPLMLLACCVVFGIAFMVWLIFHYEDYQHNRQAHTRFAYALSLTLGFTSLACFCVGYIWLILRVTA